jgi:hypothetical protein
MTIYDEPKLVSCPTAKPAHLPIAETRTDGYGGPGVTANGGNSNYVGGAGVLVTGGTGGGTGGGIVGGGDGIDAVGGSGGDGIYAQGGGSFAGFFGGDVYVEGALSKSSGSFKMDHPLDPRQQISVPLSNRPI